ncbi:MAG: SDR family oxidoreductase, partial [Armatimonadetes bacterium]|nr:SDR family oxidoreductase [Anaerolineae bacterium]
EHARERFGRVRLLVNAAGVYKAEPIANVDEWDWRRVIDVNLTGAFFMCQLLGRVLTDEGDGGAMVNIASAGGLATGMGYSASKAGLIGMTRQAALEFAPHGIRVNAVCVGGIAEDDMPVLDLARIPLGRVGTSDDIAAAVLYLCSDAAAFITGQTLTVDGGRSLV